MGMITDMEIKAWQERAGLKPATGEVLNLWCELQSVAFEAIRIAELEKSGIRDGDGCWHGGDVLGGMWSDLKTVVTRLEAAYDNEWKGPLKKILEEPPF